MKRHLGGTGTCPECNKPCTAHIEDFGIGAYEYWGARGVHHDYRAISDCCEALVNDFQPYDYSPEDRYGDY